MLKLSEEQLNSLNHVALVIIAASLQDQLISVSEQLDKANAQLVDNNQKIDFLAEQIRIMNQRKFGKASEKDLLGYDGQMTLFDYFNEAEYLTVPVLPEPQIREVAISAYRRSKTNGKRESDLEGLPARIFEHTLSEEELAVSFPHGYKELPCEVYKRLFIIPETFIVDEHHVHVYASKKNTGEIIKAPRPKDLFRKSIATPALVAAILNAKYSLAIPLDRQSKGFRSNGIDLSTNTMANWVIRSSDEYLSLIYDKLHSALYDCSVIHADETPVKVMRIENQKISNGRRSYMWVYRSSASQDEKPVILYDWQPSRRADHPRDFLKSFSGVVVTDGYQVYHKISHERKDLTIAGCWVHARRPFA